jgi:hypothetical protein
MFTFEKKLKSFFPRLGILLVLLSFGVMTGLAPVLHAHELDFSESHDNCAPCHWSQSSHSDETTTVAVVATPPTPFLIFSPAESIGQQFNKNTPSRSPPLYS